MDSTWRSIAFLFLFSLTSLKASHFTFKKSMLLKNVQAFYALKNRRFNLPWQKCPAFLSYDLHGEFRLTLGKISPSKSSELKNICCCKTDDILIRGKKSDAEHSAAMDEFKKKRLEFIAEPYITLEMFLEHLKNDASSPKPLQTASLKAATWIVNEMEKYCSLDGTTLEYYKKFNSDYFARMRPYYDRIWQGNKWLQVPGRDITLHDLTRLQFLLAITRFREESNKIRFVFDREFEWHRSFFINKKCVLQKKFDALIERAEKAKNQCQQDLSPESKKTLKCANAKIKIFSWAASAIIHNVNVRMKRIYASIFQRFCQMDDGAADARKIYNELHRRSKFHTVALTWEYFASKSMRQIPTGTYCIPPDLFSKRFETLTIA